MCFFSPSTRYFRVQIIMCFLFSVQGNSAEVLGLFVFFFLIFLFLQVSFTQKKFFLISSQLAKIPQWRCYDLNFQNNSCKMYPHNFFFLLSSRVLRCFNNASEGIREKVVLLTLFEAEEGDPLYGRVSIFHVLVELH